VKNFFVDYNYFNGLKNSYFGEILKSQGRKKTVQDHFSSLFIKYYF